ncbi:MAG: hypothetical protein MJY93_09415 [Fibrobacter sp.]|nr:hypothetical protein [Fibrobacter sp.]
MKKKLPAFLLMLAVPLSIVAYVKVAALSGSELLGVLAAMGLYILVFFLLAVFFNSRSGEDQGPAVSAFDELEETRKLAAQLGKVADEAAAQKKSEESSKK